MFSGRSRNLHTIGYNFARYEKVPGHNSVFIDGDTLYSYGYHFPLAKRLGGGVFVINSDRYSNTTARHKSQVMGGIMSYGNPLIIECSGCDIDNYHSDMEEFITEAVKKLRNCRDAATHLYSIRYCLDAYHRVCKRMEFVPRFKPYDEFIQNLVQTDMKIKKKLIKYHMEA